MTRTVTIDTTSEAGSYAALGFDDPRFDYAPASLQQPRQRSRKGNADGQRTVSGQGFEINHHNGGNTRG